MAMSAWIIPVRVTVSGLALAGTLMFGAAALTDTSVTIAQVRFVAHDDPTPPPPGPPEARVPADPAPAQGAPLPHRRHIDGDPNIGH